MKETALAYNIQYILFSVEKGLGKTKLLFTKLARKRRGKEREKIIQQLSVTFVGSLYILHLRKIKSDLHIQLY